LPELPGLENCQESKQEKILHPKHETAKKVLAFLFYSCYKMTSPPHWRVSFEPSATLLFLSRLFFFKSW